MAEPYKRKFPIKNFFTPCGEFTILTILRQSGATVEIQIDTADVDLVRHHIWRISTQRNGRIEAAKGKSYAQVSLGRYLCQPPVGKIVLYIDGNPLNCRRSNMRIGHQSDLKHPSGYGVTGEAYIHIIASPIRPYQVRKTGVKFGRFATLDEAVAWRDKHLTPPEAL